MSAQSPAPSSVARLAALFLVSCGLLLFEIALTKIFSIVLWYHFGFLVISIALLGFAMSGVWLARNPARLEQGSALLSRLAGWAALTTAASVWIVAHTQVDAFSIIKDHNEGPLLMLVALLLVPLFLLGATISATLTIERRRAGGFYSANLLGSGAGCALAIALFDGLHLSATDAVLWSAVLMALGALGFALEVGKAPALRALVALLVCLCFANWSGRERALYLSAPKSKPLFLAEEWERTHNLRSIELAAGGRMSVVDYTILGDQASVIGPYRDEQIVPLSAFKRNAANGFDLEPQSLIEFTEWTSLSRVDAFTWPADLGPWGLWGLSDQWQGAYPRQKGITIDSWAMTNVMEWKAGERPPEILEYLPASLVHRVAPQAEMLCIGAGGGMDLLTAARFGAKRIVGVEINPSVVGAVKSAFLDFQGGLYDPRKRPNVEIHVAEGRHFLETSAELFDVVQLSGVDTASTTQSGAFNLAENFLYTEQAFDTYLERLRPAGFVTLTRWFLPDDEGYAREDLRLFVMAWQALERAGVADPGQCIYYVLSGRFTVVLFSRQELSDEQIGILDLTCAEKNFKPLYHPRHKSVFQNPHTQQPTTNHYESFAAALDKQAWLDDYPYDVAAPVDNRPFFFETSRFRQIFKKESFFNPLGGITAHGILVILFVLVALVAWFFVLRPLLELRQRERTSGRPPRPLAAVVLYFGALGLGFILVEVVLAQKFILYLGNPLYALAVVLFSVLVFSGIGSALSSRVGDARRALAVVIGLALLYPLIVDQIFDASLSASTPVRIAISVALLAPLALAMGMPFALGIKRIAEEGADLSSWAWGINGYTSVVGSVLTIVLSISIGFNAVVWLGACVYAVAWAVSPKLATPTRS